MVEEKNREKLAILSFSDLESSKKANLNKIYLNKNQIGNSADANKSGNSEADRADDADDNQPDPGKDILLTTSFYEPGLNSKPNEFHADRVASESKKSVRFIVLLSCAMSDVCVLC